MARRLAFVAAFIAAPIAAQFFAPPPPPFDCSRIAPRFCCTSRVRSNCPLLCAQQPCSPPSNPFGLPAFPFLPPLTLPNIGIPRVPQQPPPALIGQPPPQRPPQGPPQGTFPPAIAPPPGLILPPEGTPLAAGEDTDFSVDTGGRNEGQIEVAPSAAVGAGGSFAEETEMTPFPTLVPFVPTTVQQTVGPSAVTAASFSPTPLPPQGPIDFSGISATPRGPPASSEIPAVPPSVVRGPIDGSARQTSGRKAAVLKPPVGGELVELEIDDRVETRDSKTATAIASRQFPEAIDGIANTIMLGSNKFRLPPMQTPPPTPPPRTTMPEKGGWSFKITPSKDTTFGGSRDLPLPFDKDEWLNNGTINPSETVQKSQRIQNGTVVPSSANNGGIFSDKFNVVIDTVLNRKAIEAITNLTGRRPPSANRRMKTKPVGAPSPSSLHSTTPLPFTNTFTNTSSLISAECGQPPHFKPCVPLDRANIRLLKCCEQKLMPAGCLPLCRYDTTQAEIKRAFDAGRCGILNVAPFLECASQAADNRQCCSHRGVSAKSGPQCDVFCHPRDGLGSLGLQHLVCQNVIADLLQCHHSGLRE